MLTQRKSTIFERVPLLYIRPLNVSAAATNHTNLRGWLDRAMVLGSFQCRGVLLLWHMVGQGPAVRAAGAGWVGYVLFFFIGLSEPEFYGDLVYKFKKIVSWVVFSDQFRKIIVRYNRIGYNINIMRQSACLVFNPITVNNFASLFNCTPVGRASDSMMAPT